MKKRYTLTLDGVETDRLKRVLRKNGIAFSAYVNGCVRATLSSGVGGGTKDDGSLFLVAVQPVVNRIIEGKQLAKGGPEQAAFPGMNSRGKK